MDKGELDYEAVVQALKDEIDAVKAGRSAERHALLAGQHEEVLEDEDGTNHLYRFRVADPGRSARLLSGQLEVIRGRDTIRVDASVISVVGQHVRLLLDRDLGSRIPEAELWVSDAGILEATLERIQRFEPRVRSALRLADGQTEGLQPMGSPGGPYDSDALNRWQWAAVEMGARCRYSVVHGPPGTGKTRTASHLVARLVREGRRVLVAAPTNRATDVLLLASLDALGWSPDEAAGRVARVGTIVLSDLEDRYGEVVDWDRRMLLERDRLEKELHRVGTEIETLRQQQRECEVNTLGLESAIEGAHREAAALEEARRSILSSTVDKAQVLAVTTCRAALNSAYAGRDHLILDEAGMCPFPEALLLLASNHMLTAFGDSRQLGPVVVSNTASTRRVLGRSLLDPPPALPNAPPAPQGRIPSVLLREQYRLGEMAGFVSELSYDGRLYSAPAIGDGRRGSEASHAQTGLRWLNLHGRLAAAGRPSPESAERRWECRDQAKLIVDCAHSIVLDMPPGAGRVTIVSPYRNHVSALRAAARKRGLRDELEISTVHGLQGQERSVVILSLPNVSDRRLTGFLAARSLDADGGRLITVAVSRATDALVVAGDLTSLAAKAPRGGVLLRMLGLLKAMGRPFEERDASVGNGRVEDKAEVHR